MRPARSLPVSRVEMGLGVAIGAITFSGSVIAFLKLNGNMRGKPILLPLRHVINLGTLAAILGLIAYLHAATRRRGSSGPSTALSFAIGFLLIIPIGGADMPVVISMLNSYSGWAAAAMGFTLHNTRDDHHRRAGRLVGRDPQLHHVPGDEPQLHLASSPAASARSPAGRRRKRSTGPTSAARPRTPPS